MTIMYTYFGVSDNDNLARIALISNQTMTHVCFGGATTGLY